MYDEDDLLPVSALQHLVFCERQWALIHLEGQWAENALTSEGRLMHSSADEPSLERHADALVARGLMLRSLRLGLSGKADVVEFRPASAGQGIAISGHPGLWMPYPVEYKRGRAKTDLSDSVQLCAQALCLEEMTGATVAEGALFYGQPRRRFVVAIDEALRTQTEALAHRLHDLTDQGITPPARYRDACNQCSLMNRCLPRVTEGKRSALAYLDRQVKEALKDVEGGST